VKDLETGEVKRVVPSGLLNAKPVERRVVMAKKRANGTWSKAQLARWGVPYPPPKGWITVLHRLWLAERP
jgi:hypothetical protein